MTLEPVAEIIPEQMDQNRTVLKLLTHKMKTPVLLAMSTRPDLFGLGETELFKKLSLEKKKPSDYDNHIRLKFWLEYDRCQAEGLNEIEPARIYGNAMDIQTFYMRYLQTPERVAWMMCIPKAYTDRMQEGLDFGLRRLREILELDYMMEVKRGKKWVSVPHTKLIDIQMKIIHMLDQRVNGGTVSKNLHIHSSNADVAKLVASNSMEAIEARIKQLEAKEKPKMVEAEIVETEDGA